MSPENQWLEDVFPTEIVPFRGHVSFRGCNGWTSWGQFACFFLLILAGTVYSLDFLSELSEACVNSHQMKLQQGQSCQHLHQNPKLEQGITIKEEIHLRGQKWKPTMW